MTKTVTDDEVRHILTERGVAELTDAELISVVIRDGAKGVSAIELANQIVNSNSLTDLSILTLPKLRMVGSMGISRAALLSAAFELGRRTMTERALSIERMSNNSDVISHFKPIIAELPHEEFWAVYLGASNRVVDKIKISQGGINRTIVDNRLVIKRALDKLALSIILVHNHPSGNPAPSDDDVSLTTKLRDSANLFDIELLDHIIITSGESFSFRGNGLI